MADDQYLLDTPAVRAFVADVEQAIAEADSPQDACARIEPRFAALLADPDWLTGQFAEPNPESGMGGAIGQWLIYRAGDGSLSLFSLVVPPGAETPIHDHLAWGLVGLYRGAQHEDVFTRHGEHGFQLIHTHELAEGDFYALFPPLDDIHRVRTTSSEPSISIHLLTNDTGCVLRHTYDAETGHAHDFRSGYGNAECADETVQADCD